MTDVRNFRRLHSLYRPQENTELGLVHRRRSARGFNDGGPAWRWPGSIERHFRRMRWLSHRTWVIYRRRLPDGRINHEAIGLAGRLQHGPAECAVGRQPHHYRR